LIDTVCFTVYNGNGKMILNKYIIYYIIENYSDACNSFSAMMTRYGTGYLQDMYFLQSDVWPRVQSVAYCHDSFSCRKYQASHPFPVHRQGTEHLGQVFDQFSVGRPDDIETIKRAAVNVDCVLPFSVSETPRPANKNVR